MFFLSNGQLQRVMAVRRLFKTSIGTSRTAKVGKYFLRFARFYIIGIHIG